MMENAQRALAERNLRSHKFLASADWLSELWYPLNFAVVGPQMEREGETYVKIGRRKKLIVARRHKVCH